MEKNKAKEIALQLQGKVINDWIVGPYIDSGKSAFVCKASKGTQKGAIKIYDQEIVATFGSEDLGERIRRQLLLIGKKHDNLISIYGGGYCDKHNIYYLIMEVIEGKKLSEIIDILPRDKLRQLISQIASAAQCLEKDNLVHRDIKPDNIVITDDFNRAVLLDFGVIRPLGESDCTDRTDTTPFLATLRYSSPEYLLRKENNSLEGWRALTYYQIGGVMHDMIMRYPLFKDQSEPYARLVQAVINEEPTIQAEDVNIEMIHLTKKCLLKNPQCRFQIIQWEEFNFIKQNPDLLQNVRDRIRNRKQIIARSISQLQKTIDQSQREIEQYMYDIRIYIESCIRDTSINSNHFPPFNIEYITSIELSSFTLKINYKKSEKYALSFGIVLFININLLDISTKIIQLECAMGLSDYNEGIKPPDVMMVFYEGLYDEKMIKNKINEILHFTLDKAQEICERTSKNSMHVEIVKPLWFSLSIGE